MSIWGWNRSSVLGKAQKTIRDNVSEVQVEMQVSDWIYMSGVGFRSLGANKT